MEPDLTHRDHTHFHHILRSVEQAKKLPWKDLKAQGSGTKDHKCQRNGELQRFINPVLPLSPVIVRKNRDQTIVQSENRHEEEALKLEIHAEHRCRGLGKTNQDQIHQVTHDRSDRHHQNRRNRHIIDLPDHLRRRMEYPPKAQMQFPVFPEIQNQPGHRRNTLSHDCRVSRSGHAHFGKSQKPEDQDRVKNDIDDGTGDLRDHGIDRLSG